MRPLNFLRKTFNIARDMLHLARSCSNCISWKTCRHIWVDPSVLHFVRNIMSYQASIALAIDYFCLTFIFFKIVWPLYHNAHHTVTFWTYMGVSCIMWRLYTPNALILFINIPREKSSIWKITMNFLLLKHPICVKSSLSKVYSYNSWIIWISCGCRWKS